MIKNELGLSGEKIGGVVYSDIFSSIGMIRGEYLLREINQNILLENAKVHVAEYVESICALYGEKLVWYRFSELTVEEANVLEGTCEFLTDRHPLFGMRGLRRHLHYRDEFLAEIRVLVKVSQSYPNLAIFLPFVNDAKQLSDAISLIRAEGFLGEIGCMIELPSAYFDLAEILKTGISKVVVGMNDLTSFIFATVRDSPWHQMESPIMYNVIDTIFQKATKAGIRVSIAGYLSAPFIQKMNEKGISCIVHYHQIPQIYSLPVEHTEHLESVKRRTKKYIELNNK